MTRATRSAAGLCASLLALIPISGAAQSPIPPIDAPALRLMLCSKIKDDGPRLKCFDEALAALAAPAKAPEATSTERGWEIQESKSPVDDSPQVSAALLADKLNGGIFFRCRERQIDGSFVPEGFINSSRDGIKGLYRVNGEKPVDVRWSSSTNSNSAFFNNAAAFLRLLPDDGKLFVRVYDYRGAAHDATFSLGKVSEARARIFAACAAAAAKGKSQ
jgi:hypothetical protein